VPQGSQLGPLLFVLYINDLDRVVKCNLSLYADDSKLYKRISSDADCNLLQQDLYNVAAWCSMWHLKLNYDKCMFISFTNKKKPIIFNYEIDDINLSRVDTVKDLGVYLTHNLNYTTHINSIISKAFKLLGFLKRTSSEFSNVRAIKALFVSLVRSQLEYASQVWSPHQGYLIDKIEC
jgi:ribonuclease P/MRP protein subunit RPP40